MFKLFLAYCTMITYCNESQSVNYKIFSESKDLQVLTLEFIITKLAY